MARISILYKRYIEAFPNSLIAVHTSVLGDDISHGSFSDALKEGRYEDAMYRADDNNLIKLEQLAFFNYIPNALLQTNFLRLVNGAKKRKGLTYDINMADSLLF